MSSLQSQSNVMENQQPWMNQQGVAQSSQSTQSVITTTFREFRGTLAPSTTPPTPKSPKTRAAPGKTSTATKSRRRSTVAPKASPDAVLLVSNSNKRPREQEDRPSPNNHWQAIPEAAAREAPKRLGSDFLRI